MRIFKHILLALAAGAGLFGCDSATSSNDASTVTTGFAIKGKLAGTGFKSAQVCLDGTCVYPDATTGAYTLAGTTTKAAARAASAALDTAYIIVGNDTLKEIPITSWNTIIPEKYIVQRNVAVTVPTKYTKGDVQFVYWDNDSIAHAVGVPKTSGLKHSAYVYTYYDSASFTNHDTIFSWFARVKMHDSVKTGTGINKLTYDAGDVVIDSSDFSSAVFVTEYYKTIPSGDTLREYVSGTAATTYSNRKDSVLAYTLADSCGINITSTCVYAHNGSNISFVLAFSDSSINSAKITVTVADTVAGDSVGVVDENNQQRKFATRDVSHTFTMQNPRTGSSSEAYIFATYKSYTAKSMADIITDLKVYYFKN